MDTTTTTTEVLAQVTDLRARIAATRRRQDGLWADMTYASVDDRDREAISLYRVLIGLEQQIEALALTVTEPAPGWPGGWLLGSTAGDAATAWLRPRDLDWQARIPAWRTRTDAETALAALLTTDHGHRRRPAGSWRTTHPTDHRPGDRPRATATPARTGSTGSPRHEGTPSPAPAAAPSPASYRSTRSAGPRSRTRPPTGGAARTAVPDPHRSPCRDDRRRHHLAARPDIAEARAWCVRTGTTLRMCGLSRTSAASGSINDYCSPIGVLDRTSRESISFR